MLGGALQTMRLDISRWPSEQEGLALLQTKPSDATAANGWAGPYLNDAVPMDPRATRTSIRRHPAVRSLTPCIRSVRTASRAGKGRTPTSAICRATPPIDRRDMRQAGFTLLEMIVVLAILGLATAIVTPSLLRGIDSWQRQSELDSVLDQAVRCRAMRAEAVG